MTKWLITFGARARTKWQFVEFGGPTGSESRGIVDILAIRKDHSREDEGLKRGDWFEIVLIQAKGGSAPKPTGEDIQRLSKLSRLYHARDVVLAEWKKGQELRLYRLVGSAWLLSNAKEVFGVEKRITQAV